MPLPVHTRWRKLALSVSKLCDDKMGVNDVGTT